MIRAEIEKAITEALATLGVPDVTFSVERPGDMAHGDYATNAALAAAKALNGNPRDVAGKLAALIVIDGVKNIEIAGPGFINFTLAGEAVKSMVHEAHEKEWGCSDLHRGKKVMVEYTDPNPFKEFHIGHLMSNTIGESIARLFEKSGALVTHANYQGDVGLHVAKSIWGKMQKPELTWGEAYVFGNTEYEAHKEEVDAINKKVYDKSDVTIQTLYARGREESLAHFEELYKVLDTKFDRYYFESESTPLGLALVKDNPAVFEESDGARVYRGEQDGLHTRVFLTSQGLPTYEAKDLGLLALKSREPLDISIIVTASEQADYFKVVLAAAGHLEAVKDIAAKTQHVTHGMMRFASGKMSSRKGNVITGESLLEDLIGEAKEKMRGRELADVEGVAQQIAVGAVKYTVLRQSSNKDIVFDPEKSLSLEGDSGPYLQYALVRARALLRNAAAARVEKPAPAEPTFVERLVIHFPATLERAARELEPHYVTTYLTELAGAFNAWYANERLIIDGAISSRALAVVKAVENTLKVGLNVLGIPAPEKM